MIVYDTILGIHAKNGTENSFKRSFYGTWLVASVHILGTMG
jgi:hypothetical protein